MSHKVLSGVKKADRTRILRILERSEYFREFPRSLADQLISIGRIRRCGNDEMLCRLDEIPRHVWVVLEGALYYSNISSKGAELIYGMVGRGSFVGFAVVVDGMGMHSDIRARGPTELLEIAKTPLLHLLDRKPRLWKFIAALTARRLRIVVEKGRARVHASLEERTAWELLAHANHLGAAVGAPILVRLPVSQADFAKVIGISRSRLSGILRRFAAQGLVQLKYRSITLLDPVRLRRMVMAPALSI